MTSPYILFAYSLFEYEDENLYINKDSNAKKLKHCQKHVVCC